VFPGGAWKDKTPLDFRTDKETGLREGLTVKPSGVVKHNLKPGIGGATIPPIATWNAGKYIESLDENGKKAFVDYVESWELFDAYVVTGEFTPGNYVARIYILPKNISHDPEPDHPSKWSVQLQKGDAITSYSTGTAWKPGRPWSTSAPGAYHSPAQETKPAVPPPAAKPAVPAKIRVRCGGCGHWFRMDDVGPHAEYCCPGINEDSDWGFQCECCDTLDEVQALKPGFPRPKKEPEKKEEVKDGDNTVVAGTGQKPAAKPKKEAVGGAD
jgi:hypothetical protein